MLPSSPFGLLPLVYFFSLTSAANMFETGSGLSLNNPGRFQLIDLAEDFRQRAKELEMKRHSNSNAARRYTAQPSLEQAIFERQNPAGIQLLSDQYI